MSARLLKVVQHACLLGKAPFAVHVHLLIDPRDQAIERISVVGSLVADIHVNRVGVRLGIGRAGRGLPKRPRRDPRGTAQIEGMAQLDPTPPTLGGRHHLLKNDFATDDQLHGLHRRDLADHADLGPHPVRTCARLADDPSRPFSVHLEQEQRPGRDEAAPWAAPWSQPAKSTSSLP